MKFNIIGFSSTPTTQYRHCVIHPHIRLEQDLADPDKLLCPYCGVSYLPNETTPEGTYQSKFGPQQSKIITAKKKKKYYDKAGREITDPDLIAEIERGAHVISYQEILPPNTNSETNSTTTRIHRKTN